MSAQPTYDQVVREVYGTVTEWEHELHRRPRRRVKFGAGRGSDTEGAAARNSRPTLWERELADTLEGERLKRERRAVPLDPLLQP